jgi:hypothetical protein
MWMRRKIGTKQRGGGYVYGVGGRAGGRRAIYVTGNSDWKNRPKAQLTAQHRHEH